MKGKHHIVIESDKLKYEFDIKRNITVIQGDSASGKTTLIELLQLYSQQGDRSGIRLQSDVPCTVYGAGADQWHLILSSINGSIVFIDEDYTFVFRKDFASLVMHSDNYYVIITRRPLKNLPYSIQEIYGIRTTGKYHFPEQIYHEFYPIYPYTAVSDLSESIRPVLLLEDQGAGYQFYETVCSNHKCISAQGNSNIFKKLTELQGEQTVLVIADGAAFGAYVDSVVKAASNRTNIALYFPESFEWMILRSGILENNSINEILEHSEDYIDSKEYLSWEQYFTELLETSTRDIPYMKYKKDHLPHFYMSKKNASKILQVIPKDLLTMDIASLK